MLRTTSCGLAVLALILAVPAAAAGEVLTLGSSLSAPATLQETHPVDSAYWHTAIPGGASPAMPADGQVDAVTIRGFARSDTPEGGRGGGERELFVQTLAPEGEGFRVRLTSAPFFAPAQRGSGPDTRTTFRPGNLCARRGDRVALSSIGGAGGGFGQGTPMQLFARVPGAVASRYTKPGGFANGAAFSGGERADRPDTELLMQIALRTGADAAGACRGPGPTPTPTPSPAGGTTPARPDPPARVPAGVRLAVRRTGFASLAVFCSRRADCRGRLTLAAAGTTLGRATYAISRGRTQAVRVRLRDAGLRLVERRRFRLSARATLVTQPGRAAATSSRTVRVRRSGA